MAMSVTIDLSPDLERRLAQQAARHGQTPADYARAAIEEKLATAGSAGEGGSENPLYSGLPRRDPAELADLARQQGAPVAVRFEDLLGDFWPEDESTDEVLETLREWRREGHATSRE
jgi:hypothetical protein